VTENLKIFVNFFELNKLNPKPFSLTLGEQPNWLFNAGQAMAAVDGVGVTSRATHPYSSSAPVVGSDGTPP
jgi:hypothetical protein